MLKAHNKGVKIILPTDFVTLSKPKLGNEAEVKTGEIGHEGTDHMSSFKPGESALETVGEVNWIDLIYDEAKQVVDFTNFIEQKLDELYNPAQKPKTPQKPSSAGEEVKEDGAQENDPVPEPDPVPSHELESKAYILEYGGTTMQNVLANTKDAMKLFWDGSISVYPDTFAHENNKTMTFDLLRIRTENEDRSEPKYSLIHSEETEIVVNQSMAKIKLDQMDSKDPEGSLGGNEESDSRTSTFQHENISPSIFTCAEGRFTLRLLQGIENKWLLNVDEHPALTKQQIEEDLAVLDEI